MSLDQIPREHPSVRSLLLPREHGSWSLALEPLVLGLIAAPSWPGAALAGAGVAVFLMRRPWHVARASNARQSLALSVLGVLAATAALGVTLGLMRAAGPASVALLAALPAGAAFAWFDSRRAARELAAELAGTMCFAALPAAIALAGGRPVLVALALSGFALARALTTMLAVRTLLRRRKREPVSRMPAVVATLASILVFAEFARRTGVWLPAAWTVVFALRTGWWLGPWAPAWPARRFGVIELVLGAASIISTGLSLR